MSEYKQLEQRLRAMAADSGGGIYDPQRIQYQRMVDEDVEPPQDRADKARWEREHRTPKYMALIDDAIVRAKHFKAMGRWP